VHRWAETSFDISADLTELGQTDVAVVSAGVKSILDIGLTLESLETLGVPVVGFGTDEFPSFYSRTSGHRSPMRVDTVEELAAMMQAKWDLGLAGGISIANPVPAEDEIPAVEIGALVDQALRECEERGIRGKGITPFLLGRIVELSGGRSLETNIALVRSNARLGAALALAYQRLA
jgi:pseudouridine-5'-phosphate glycosidase